MELPDPLAGFSGPTRAWFEQAFGTPTPPQAQGWPPIQRGEHTLILAPTGSGKTLAAFLWSIDRIYRTLGGETAVPASPGVSLLYVSPLKALNNDIERNLARAPRRHPRDGPAHGPGVAPPAGGGAYGGHARPRAGADAQGPASHPDHHA